jgi:hypothetical protein
MMLYNSPSKRLQEWTNDDVALLSLQNAWESESVRPGESPLSRADTALCVIDDFNTLKSLGTVDCIVDQKQLFAHCQRPVSSAPATSQFSEVSTTVTKCEEPIEDQGQWIYSRVHGYKIWVAPEDSRQTYNKILKEINSSSITNDEIDDNESVNHGNVTSVVTQQDHSDTFDSNINNLDIYRESYYKDYLCSLLQFTPLRSTCTQHEKMIELTPERVVLFEDIEKLLIPVTLSESISITPVETLSLHLKHLILSLSALGVISLSDSIAFCSSNSHLAQQEWSKMSSLQHRHMMRLEQDVNSFWTTCFQQGISRESRLSWISQSSIYDCYCPSNSFSMGVYPSGHLAVHADLIQSLSSNVSLVKPLDLAKQLITEVLEEYTQLPNYSLGLHHVPELLQWKSHLRSLLLSITCVQSCQQLNHVNLTDSEFAHFVDSVRGNCEIIIQQSIQQQEPKHQPLDMETMFLTAAPSQLLTNCELGDLRNWCTFLGSKWMLSIVGINKSLQVSS